MTRFVCGYVRFRLSGDSIHAFLNKCKSSAVELRNLRSENGQLIFEVENSGIRICRAIAGECGLELEECSRFGLTWLFRAYRKRKLFAVTFLAFAVVFVLNCCCISRITIKGNTNLTEGQILEVLKECGIEEGTFKFSVDQLAVQKNMIKLCDRLSWAWVEIKGTHAMVEVREKVPIPEFFDMNYACNIIASRDGVITQAVASGGILYAEEGTYVKEGQLLIGGVYDSSEYTPVRFVHASGEVYARTTYTLEDNFGNEYIKYEPSEKTKTAYGIRIGNFKIEKGITGKNVLLSNDAEKKLKIFGKFYLPLAFTKRQYCEIIETKHEITDAEAEQFALSELTARLNLMIPQDAAVVNSEKSVTSNPDGTIHVKLTFECIENIGVESPIEFTQE